MKYILLILLFTSCRDYEAENYRSFLEGKREAFNSINYVVNDLLRESNARWDSIPQGNSIMLLNGRLDALTQMSIILRDSVSKYQSINQ